MARVRLTIQRIREFSTDKAQAFLWDTEAPGLAVRATPSGTKAFIFQGKLAGKDIRITIGSVDAWPLETITDKQGEEVTRGARQEARRLQTLIDQGIDPRQHKQERIAAAEAKREEARRRDVTVGEAWDSYVEARRHKWSELHLRDHQRLAHAGGETKKVGTGKTKPGPLAALMVLKLDELTPARIEEWLKKETAARSTATALAYRLLRAFMRWCAERPDYEAAVHLEAAAPRFAREHAPKAKAKEADCLQREQLPAWFTAVRALGNPVHAAYLQGLLLTGARREELAGLRWEDVDFKWRSLTIRDKVEGERIIPLTPYLAGLLLDLKNRNETRPNVRQLRRLEEQGKEWKPAPWVFSSSTAENGRLQEPRIGHNRALAAGGLPHLTLHGLRRSFGTLAEWVEVPAGVVAQIQGHKPSAIAEKHYRRRPLDLLRMWHVRIEAWILDQAGIELKAEEAGGLRLVKAAEKVSQ